MLCLTPRKDRARSPPSHNRKDQLSYDDEEDQSRGHAESSTMSDGRGHSSRYGDELGQNQGSRNMDRNLDRNPQGHPRGGAEGRSRQYESLDDPDGRPAHGRWGADTTRPSTTVLLDGLPDDVAERDVRSPSPSSPSKMPANKCSYRSMTALTLSLEIPI